MTGEPYWQRLHDAKDPLGFRLKMVRFCLDCHRNISLTAHHFCCSRATLRYWLRRFPCLPPGPAAQTPLAPSSARRGAFMLFLRMVPTRLTAGPISRTSPVRTGEGSQHAATKPSAPSTEGVCFAGPPPISSGSPSPAKFPKR